MKANVHQSVELVRYFFQRANVGDAENVRACLFHPPTISERSLDIYVDDMLRNAPYTLRRVWFRRMDAPRVRRWGNIATVWVGVKVCTATTPIQQEMLPVWWYPETDERTIGARIRFWL